MNDQIFQQAEQFFKPITEIMALNARTFEALAEKQTGLMSEMWNDGINYAKDLSDKRDAKSFYASQKDYWEGVNQKVSATARDSYNVLTDAQEEMTKLVQSSISSVDLSSAIEPFMQGAYSAQETAQRAAQSTAKTAQKAQSQAADSASKTAQSASKSASHSSSSKSHGSSNHK